MRRNFSISHLFSLLVSILLAQLAGLLGSIFTIPNIPTWYQTLNKPFFLPPSWLFAPVWTTLFLLMGVAAWLIWRQRETTKSPQEVHQTLLVYAGQLLLNVAWSMIFFGWHQPWLAFIEIIILWLTIVWTILLFYRLNRLAAWLLLPYLGWVSFASVLTYAIAHLN
jgi:tryptophan-rich sensory protein